MKVDFSKVKHGDKIRLKRWERLYYVVFIAKSYSCKLEFYAENLSGNIGTYNFSKYWELYEEPKQDIEKIDYILKCPNCKLESPIAEACFECFKESTFDFFLYKVNELSKKQGV